ncbi:Uncharacterised protein [uncultured archaeon]|nr:Uncharacterised protein [uncultured archaeon]
MNMRIFLALTLMAMLFLSFGCAAQNQAPAKNDSRQQVAPQPKPVEPKPAEAVCGNGKLEAGETAATCCQDAGCASGESCQKSAATKGYACAPVPKNETVHAKQIEIDYLKMNANMQAWIEANRTTAAGTESLFAPLDDMNTQIGLLDAAGYDTRAENALRTVLDTAYHEQVELEARINSARLRVAQAKGLARDRYLNALSLSLEEADNAIDDAKLAQTRLLKVWNEDKTARQKAVEEYGLDENLWQTPAQEQAVLEALRNEFRAEQARLAPHNQNEWVTRGSMRIRLGSLASASCVHENNGVTTSYLVIPVETENNGDTAVTFGPSSFLVRDWQKNQFAVATPAINSTSPDCVDYYQNGAGLKEQKMLAGSRSAGQVWIDIAGSYSAHPWEIYADMPNGEQLAWRIAP